MKTFYASHRSKWRAWLGKNAARASEIWLVFYKKDAAKTCVTYDDAVEEALCFGWIDTTARSLDETRYLQRFTPRKPRSAWAASNIERANRMIAEGKMTAAGLRAFDGHEARRVKANPTTLTVSLERRFKKASTAWKNFQAFPPGYRRTTIGWVASAKKEETQVRRLGKLIEFSTRNERIENV